MNRFPRADCLEFMRVTRRWLSPDAVATSGVQRLSRPRGGRRLGQDVGARQVRVVQWAHDPLRQLFARVIRMFFVSPPKRAIRTPINARAKR